MLCGQGFKNTSSIDRLVSVLFRGPLSPGCCGAGLLLEDLFAVELQFIHLLTVELLWKGSGIRHCKVVGFLCGFL